MHNNLCLILSRHNLSFYGFSRALIRKVANSPIIVCITLTPSYRAVFGRFFLVIFLLFLFIVLKKRETNDLDYHHNFVEIEDKLDTLRVGPAFYI